MTRIHPRIHPRLHPRILSLLIAALLAFVAVQPARGQAAAAGPWVAPAALAGVRAAAVLEAASATGDLAAAETVLEALRRRPPTLPEQRAQHHLLAGVAERIGGNLQAAALSFLRAAVAGPPGGPLHGPAMLEAAITLRTLARNPFDGRPIDRAVAEEAERAADRLLLEAEALVVRDADPATLARFRTQRP